MLQGIWKKHHRVTRVTTGNITTFMTSKRFIQKGKRAARESALTKRLSDRLILSFHLRGHSGPGPLHRVLTNLGVLARALGTVCARGPWPEALPPTANSRSKCLIFSIFQLTASSIDETFEKHDPTSDFEKLNKNLHRPNGKMG